MSRAIYPEITRRIAMLHLLPTRGLLLRISGPARCEMPPRCFKLRIARGTLFTAALKYWGGLQRFKTRRTSHRALNTRPPLAILWRIIRNLFHAYLARRNLGFTRPGAYLGMTSMFPSWGAGHQYEPPQDGQQDTTPPQIRGMYDMNNA